MLQYMNSNETLYSMQLKIKKNVEISNNNFSVFNRKYTNKNAKKMHLIFLLICILI